MIEDKKVLKKDMPHNLILENKGRLSISAVVDVDTFDDSKVVLYTENDTLEIEGYDLHIQKLNIADGELIIEGEILSILYTGKDASSRGKGLFSKMFK